MKTIATLGPSVRLMIFQFLMKSAQVPSIIPLKRPSITPPLPPVSGVQVMESTPKMNLLGLTSQVDCRLEYELVDVWKNPQHKGDWKMCFVRFVFCRKEHLNELSPDFIAKRGQLKETFDRLVSANLWATQGHLNPYFDKGELCVVDKVLMFGCAGRILNSEVFSGGLDENNRGVGPKVLLSTLSSRLTLTDTNEVVLTGPEKVSALVKKPPSTIIEEF